MKHSFLLSLSLPSPYHVPLFFSFLDCFSLASWDSWVGSCVLLAGIRSGATSRRLTWSLVATSAASSPRRCPSSATGAPAAHQLRTPPTQNPCRRRARGMEVRIDTHTHAHTHTSQTHALTQLYAHNSPQHARRYGRSVSYFASAFSCSCLAERSERRGVAATWLKMHGVAAHIFQFT